MIETVGDGHFVPTGDFGLGETTFQTQTGVRIGALPTGGFIAVWQGQDGYNDAGIFAQRFNNDGEPQGLSFRVNSVTTGQENEPAITVLPNGQFVIAWTEQSAYPAVFDIKGQLFDIDGARIGSEFVANTTIPGFQTSPSIGALSGGGFVVAWENASDTAADDIRAQVFDADGSRVGSELVASESRGADKLDGTLVGLAGGGFVVSWLDWTGETNIDEWGNTSPGPRAQIFDATGNKVGGAFSLNSYFPGYQQEPTLAALPDGGFVAAWSDMGDDSAPDGGHRGVWIQIFDASGQKVGSLVEASSLSPYGQSNPTVEFVSGTGFLVVWKDSNATQENAVGALRAQLFSFSGEKLGAEFAVTAGNTGLQNDNDVALLSSGSLVVGWTHSASPSWDEDVRAQILYGVTHGTANADFLIGSTGRDFILGEGGNDQISGGLRDDYLDGGDGDDDLRGGSGNDQIYGAAGNDVIYGDAGTDTIYGGAGSNVLHGGSGNDYFLVDSASDNVMEIVGEGYDVVFTNAGLSLQAGAEVEEVRVLDSMGAGAVDLAGNEFAQVLAGNEGSNHLNGLGGDDYIEGRGGVDTIDGGTGSDVMRGGTGDDYAFADNSGDRLIEAVGEGYDTLFTSATFTLEAGSEVEALRATDAASTNSFDIWGNDFGQILAGNAGNNRLTGFGGDDYLEARGGNDTLDGGTGSDVMIGGSGNDFYVVDRTSDRVIDGVGQGYDVVFTDGTFGLEATSEVEELRLTGGAGTAALNLWGNDFGQVVAGNNGENFLSGGGGDDYIEARAGNDRLEGGAGNDVLIGGDGQDVFGFGETGGADRITDFLSGTDQIDLRGIDAVAGGGDDAFTWVGANAFTGVAGQLRAYSSGGINYLAGDVDGNGIADFTIDIGSASVVLADLML